MKKTRGSHGGQRTGLGDPSDDLHRLHLSEARAQVSSHKAEGIREEWADNTPTSDAELLLKLVEARYARETLTPYRAGQMEIDPQKRQAVLVELLRKAEVDGPVRPPKHARFAVFLLPRAYQHIVFGDLEEQYPEWVKECGCSKATFLYWWQFLLSTAVIMWPRLRYWRYLAVVLWLLLHILRAWH